MAVYALYNNSDLTLAKVFTSKTEAQKAHKAEYDQGLKTYKHLTKTQVEKLSYTEATFFETVMEAN